jgi:cell division septation protein DedD
MVVLCIASCDGPRPSAPTPVRIQQQAAEPADPPRPAATPVTTPTPAGNPTPPSIPWGSGGTAAARLCADIRERVSCLVESYSAEGASVRVTNQGGVAKEAHLTAYARWSPDSWATQRLYADHGATIAPGDSAVLAVRFPTCAWQLDAYIGSFKMPPHVVETLLGFEGSADAQLCAEQPTPTPTPRVSPTPVTTPTPTPTPTPKPKPTPTPMPTPTPTPTPKPTPTPAPKPTPPPSPSKH